MISRLLAIGICHKKNEICSFLGERFKSNQDFKKIISLIHYPYYYHFIYPKIKKLTFIPYQNQK